MSCKSFFSKTLKGIGFIWIFLFFSFVHSQDIIEISQINGINVPAAAPPSPIGLSATCPNSTYELGVTIRNNSGAPINFGATSLNISLTLTGVNASVSNTILSSGSLNAGTSSTVTFVVDLSNPGFNTFTVSITGAAIGTESSTDLDDNIAAATITSNPIPSTATLNSSAGTTVCEGDIVTISSGGGSTYHFFLNGAPLTANPTNDSSFSMTTLSNGDKISVRVVDVSGCISTNSKTFTVNQTPNSGGGGTLVDMQGSVPGEVEESTEFQIDRIQISNNSSASDKYYATVNGVLYTYTSVGVETPTTIAIGLADQIDDDANIGSAVANSGPGGPGSIEITSNAKGMSYPITVSKSPGASSNIGTQLIQAGTTFTICNAATDILATGPTSVTTYTFTLGGVPKALKGGQTSITTLTPPISSPVILEVTGFTTNSCFSKRSVNIVVNSLTSSGSISGNQTICAGGDPGVISSLASATGSGDITYSWWAYPSDGTGWAELSPKVTTPSYDPPTLTVSTTFRRRAISTLNNKVCFTDSSVVTITVAPALVGGNLNSTAQSICSLGDPANMTVAGDTTGAPDISYQWESSITASNAGFTEISGVVSASYDPPPGVVTQTTWYRRAIIRKDGGTELCREYSDVKKLTVHTNDPGSIPITLEICNGQVTTIGSLSPASGDGGTSVVTYTWMRNNAGWGPATAPNDAITYNIPAAIYNANGTYTFRRDALVGGTCSATTNIITVIVHPALSAGTASITSAQTTICLAGDPDQISILGGTAPGPGISYLWQTSTNDVAWTDTPVTTQVYDPVAGSQLTDLYYRRVIIRRDAGGNELCRAESTSVLVSLNSVSAGSVTTTLNTICNGVIPPPITELAPAAGDGTITYQWVQSTRPNPSAAWSSWSNAPGGAASQLTDYQPIALTQDTRFSRGVISTDGALTCSVSSTEVIISVLNAISPATSSSSQTVCLGDVPAPLSFAGAATGAGYTNQWFESDDNITYNPIAGAFGTAYAPNAPTTTKFYKLQTTYNDGATSCTVTSTGGGGVIIVTVNNSAPTAPDITPTSGTISNTFQVTRINIGGTPSVGDKYNVSINGTTYTHTVGVGLGATSISNIAVALAAILLPDGNIGSAVANGASGAGTIELTANTAGSVFITRTSSSFGASGSIGYQLIAGSKVITICVADLGVVSLTATSTVSVGVPTYDFKINNSAEADVPDGRMLIPAGMADNVLVTTRATSSTCYTDFAVNVVVNRVTAGAIGSSVSICPTADPAAFTSLSAASAPAGANITYQWWSKPFGGGYTNTGATGAIYDVPGGLVVSTTFKRVAVSTLNGQTCSIDSNEIDVTVQPALVAGVATITTAQTTICLAGDPANITVIDGGSARTPAGPGISFLWQTSPNNLDPWTDTAITTESYDPAAGSQTTDLYYRRVVIRSSGLTELCRENSTSVFIKLNSVTAGTISTSLTTVCNGDTPNIITSLTPALSDGTVTYQWVSRTRPSSVAPWGAWAEAGGVDTNLTYQPGPLTLDTEFKRGAISTDGALTCSVSSTEVRILVNPVISTAISTSSQTVCLGDVPAPLSFAGAATGAGYTNQWFDSDDNVTYNPIAGAFGTAYAPDAPTTTKFYKLQTTYNNGGTTCTVTSTGSGGVIVVTVSNSAPTAPDITPTSGTISNTFQVTSLSLTGTPTAGDKYNVVINGNIISETAVGGDSAFTLAQRLDGKIAANGAIGSAVASGAGAAATISITANTAGSVFTTKTSTSPGASLGMGTQIITGSKLITICVADLGVVSLTATSTVSVGVPTYDFKINNSPEADVPDGRMLIPAGMADNVLVTTRATSSTCFIDFAVNVVVNRVTAGTIGTSVSQCINDDPAGFTSLSVATAPAGAALSYQWWVRSSGGTWTNTGATGAVYDAGSLSVSTTYKRIAVSNLNGQVCSIESNQVTVTVEPALVAGVATITTAQTTICLAGDPANITVIDGGLARTPAGPGISFLWQTSPNNLDPWTDTAITTESYDPAAGSQTTDLYYRRVVIRSSGLTELCRENSTSVYIALNSVTSGTITSTSTTICNGDIPNIITSVTPALADGVLTYQWVSRSRPSLAAPYGPWANAGGVATNLTYQPSALTSDTQFIRGATSTDGALTCSVSSSIITINVNPATNAATASADQVICIGESPSQLSFIGANTGPGYVNQWLESNDNVTYTAIPGAFGIAYSPPALTAARFYKLQTTYTNGGISCTTTTTGSSGIVSITINLAPNSPNITATSGVVTNTNQVTRININGVPNTGDSYSVTLNGLLLTPVIAAVGSTSLQIAQALDDIIQAQAVISTAVAGGAAAAANIEITALNPGVTFTINTSSSAGSGATIGEQNITGSKKITFCLSDMGTASITALALGPAGIDYDLFLDGNPVADTAGSILVPAAMPDNFVVTARATSNTCSIEFIANVSVNRIDGGTIGSDQTICSNEDLAPFTNIISASGPPGSTVIAYEWYIDNVKDGVDNYTKIPGATGAVLDYGSLTASATFYRVPIIDLGGVLCNPPNAAGNASLSTPNRSNKIEISVSTALVAGAIDQADETICMGLEGDPSAMTVSGGTAAGASIRFQWQRSTASALGPFADIPGVTTAGYDPPANLGVSTWFRREVIQIEPDLTEKCSAFTNPRLVEVNTVTGGTINGTQDVCSGAAPTLFTSTVDGSSNTGIPFNTGVVNYQWQRTTDGFTWINIGGANSSTYQAPALTESTQYRRLVTGTVSGVTCPTGLTTVTSNIITVTKRNNVGQPQLIRANYSGANTGNSGNGIENIISKGGTIYNNTACGTPLIESFDPCPVGNATGYEYSFSPPDAGSIDPNTGVVTWTAGWTGDVTVRIRAKGCGGVSAWTTTTFEVASSTINATAPTIPIAFEQEQVKRIYFGTSTGTTGDRWSLYIDGVEYTHYTTAGQTNAQVGQALITLVNNAVGVANRVTASGGGNPIILTADEIGRNFSLVLEQNGGATGNWWKYDNWNRSSETYCGSLSGSVPNCEITNTTPDTQFYSDSTGFASMTWDIESFPALGSPVVTAGTINVANGTVDWNPGFFGTVNIGVIAHGCDGVDSARQFNTFVIAQNNAAPADITVVAGSSIPVCPASTGQSTFFESSGYDVTWSWNNRAAGELNAYTGQVTWTTGFAGEVTLTATSMNCGFPSVSRKITIVSSSVISRTSAVGTDNSQTICKNSPELTPITYSILGDATTASISGLPAGFSGSYSTTTQVDRVTLSGISNGDQYSTSINGVTYSITIAPGDTLAAATVSLAALIMGNADIVSTTANVGGNGRIEIIAAIPNKYFYTSVGKTLAAAGGDITSQNVTGTGIFTITGTPSLTVGVNTRHDYTITTGGSTCTPTTINGFFTQSPESQLILKDAGTDNQELCNNSPITEIRYKVLGTNGASVSPLVNFEGLPPGMTPGLNTAVTAKNQKEKVTITGTTGTSSYSITINGTTTITTAVFADNIAAAAGLEAAIDGDPVLSTLVTTDDSAADGTLTITAIAAGLQFDISASRVSGTGSITIINEEGISEIRIFGTPNITLNSQAQYIYTVTTNANPAGCTPVATVTGTLKVAPLETVTYDNTINLALYPGAQSQTLCPGSSLEGISYKIGGAVGSVNVTGLPPGVSSTHSVTTQTEQYTFSTVTPTDIITILLNGVSYSRTVTLTDTIQTVAVAISTLIDNDTDAVVSTATPGGGVIRFAADVPGVPYTTGLLINNLSAPSSAATFASTVSNVNNVVIEGIPDNTAVVNKSYNYVISTPGASFCNAGTGGGTITIAEGPKFELISAPLTDSQERCNGTNIVDIEYKVTGAGGAQIPALVPATFSGLPANIQKLFTSTTQLESVTITGIGAGVDEIKVYINGVEFSSGDVANSAAAAASLTASITASINPQVNGKVTATNVGGGVMTLTATTPGTAFSLSVEGTGAGVNVTRSNQVGTGTYKIYGLLNQPDNSEVTYNYTITSLLNLNSCSAATITGTIKVEPLETVTYDNTINAALYPGAATQNLCPGTTLEGISFKVGGAVGSVSVNGLPPGVTHTHSVTAQIEQFTIAGTISTSDIITIIVNGVSYSRTVTPTDTLQTVAVAISTLIDNDTSSTVTPSTPGGGVIRLQAKTPGVPFTVSSIVDDNTGGAVPTAVKAAPSPQANVNNVVIEGSPDNTAIPNKPYAYTIETPGTTCSPTIQGGTITIAEGPKFELISAPLTDSQERCNGTNIVDIEYKVTGAGGAQIPALVPATFSGLPANIQKTFNSTTQLESVTITGIGAGVDEIKVYVNGVEFSSGDVANSAAAAASLTASITASINPQVNTKVTATNVGGGVMTLTATTPGTAFSLSVEGTGAGVNVTRSNQVGTGTYRIYGLLNQSHDSEATYNYTITSLLNLNSCSAATITGTIKVEPLETVTYDNTINAALYPGAATQNLCPGTTLQGISYKVGGAVGSVSVNGLPPGVTHTHSVTAQIEQFTVGGVLENLDEITILVNGVSYLSTVTAASTAQSIALEIATLINNDVNSTVTASSTAGGQINITAKDAGVPFITSSIAENLSGGGAPTAAKTAPSPQANVNNVVIGGTPDNTAIIDKPYAYSIETPGTTCSPTIQGGVITVSSGPIIELTSVASTVNQEVCNTLNIVDITYKIIGAGGAQIPAKNALTFTGLPNSLSQQFNSTTQEELVTISGVTGAVDEIKVYVNGVEFSSGDVNTPTLAAAALVTSITTSINPQVNGKITASNVAGALTLKALTAGTPFTLSVAATGGTAAVTKANQVGTGLFTIKGQLTESHSSEITYNYTINTTLNGSCNSASATGTIKIIPEEAIAHDPLSDPVNFGGPANQDVCENENILGIRFNLTGGANSVSGPTAVPPAINGLPPGLSLNHVRENQVEEYTIAGIANTNIITVIVNGISYTKTANASDTNATMAQGIVNLIENNVNSTVTASSTAAGKILLTADDEGVPFTTSGIATGGGASITKTAVGVAPQNNNENYVTLSGSPSENVSSTKIYNYTLTTTGTVCADAVYNGSITINPISEISLFSAATTANQIACNGAVIDDIVYSIGGGGTGATVSGLPGGLSSGYDPILRRFTIQGTINSVVSSKTTFTYTVSTTNGNCDPETSMSGTIIVSPDITINTGSFVVSQVSCAGNTDGAITVPDAAITGGVLSIAQVDRINITRPGGSPVEGDLTGVIIDGTTINLTVLDQNGSFGKGDPVESDSSIATRLANKINTTAGINVTALANGFGAGTIKLTANSAGVPFTASATSTLTGSSSHTITRVANVANSTLTYTYNWSKDGASGYSYSKSITGLGAGVYTLTVGTSLSGSCSTTSDPITITEPTALSVSVVGNCAGAFTATTVGGTAPYVYTLVNEDGSDDGGGAATNALTKAYTGKTIGATYVVKVTDINGCIALSPPHSNFEGLTIDVTKYDVQNQRCFGRDEGAITKSSTVTTTVTGGSGFYSYSWTGPSGTFNTENVTGLAAGSYQLTVTDLNYPSCTENATVVIQAATAITITPDAGNSTQMYCPVASETVVGADWGTLAVSVSGGTVSPTYQYQWVKMPSGVNISNSFGGNTNSIRINSGGDYMVIVSDANALVSTGNVSASTASCSVSQLFSVSGPSEPLSAEIVLGSNDKVTGGNVEILFDTSSTTISCKGDSNGSFTFVIKGGSPPYEYKNGGGGWTSASGATVQLTGLSADTYNIRVRDAGKCVSGGEEGVTLSLTQSGTTTDNIGVIISEPSDELSASLSGAANQQDIDCATGIDGKIEISVTGGQPPYQLIWTGPAGSNFKSLTSIDNSGDSSSISFLKNAGDYSVTITDAAKCILTEEYTLKEASGTEDKLGKPTITVTPGACGTDEKPTMEVVLNGGTPTSIEWRKKDKAIVQNNMIIESTILVPQNGDEFTITINGTDFKETLTVTPTKSSISSLTSALALKVNSADGITATVVNEKIQIKGDVIGLAFEYSDSVSRVTGSFSDIKDELKQSAQEIVDGWITQGGGEFASGDGKGDGNLIVNNVPAGLYLVYLNDDSGCSPQTSDPVYVSGTNSSLGITVDSSTGGLEYFNTCSYSATPITANFKFTLLGATSLVSITLNGTVITQASGKLAVASGGRYTILDLAPGDYEIAATDPNNPGCPASQSFTVNESTEIKYIGETELSIEKCQDKISLNFEPLTDFIEADNLDAFYTGNSDPYYALELSTPAGLVIKRSSFRTAEEIATNINTFELEEGLYTLKITNNKGCTNDPSKPILINVTQEISNIVVSEGLVDASGNPTFSNPVSCLLDAKDGKIGINIAGGPANAEINWEYLDSNDPTSTGWTSLPEYKGYLSMNDLEKGKYRYTITDPDPLITGNCASKPYAFKQGVIEVEDDKSLVISDGPYVDNNLCNNKPGILRIDVIDAQQAPVTFYYGTDFTSSKIVTHVKDDIDSYIVTIDEPKNLGYLYVVNDRGCTKSAKLEFDLGTPGFEYSTPTYNNSISEDDRVINARQEITFNNQSTSPYTKVRWDWGDNVFEEIVIADSSIQTDPALQGDSDGDGWLDWVEFLAGTSIDPTTGGVSNTTPKDEDGDGVWDNQTGVTKGDAKHSYGIQGTYLVTLQIENELGCFDQVTKPVKVGKGYFVLPPNVFTPNGDKKNDYFGVLFSGFCYVEFTIYDNTGNVVYPMKSSGENPKISSSTSTSTTSTLGYAPNFKRDEGGNFLGGPNETGPDGYPEFKPWDGKPEGSDELGSAPYYIWTLKAWNKESCTGEEFDAVVREGAFIILR